MTTEDYKNIKNGWKCGVCKQPLNIDKGLNEAYAHQCSNTPDTEWEKNMVEDFILLIEDLRENPKDYDSKSMQNNINWFRKLLTSRDTYWKERVRKEVKELIPNYEITWDTDKQTGEICVLLFEVKPDRTKQLMQEINTAMGSATTGRIAINPKFALPTPITNEDNLK